ncbi:sensor histidine kinase [Extibacter muris]|uniref:sensor histidine kinase n=1 Tax=Extibacter muris TaxID=1796622 RepID=UPI001D092586|nr:sensor histidine kinase [Extibacter muris]MCB6201443.1 sensor histidine kinase [Extibacter muris]MCQ4662769.1 sensor histidine kinase [Extibacter muris]MCQ4694116.1 sensor histidine kinase [Extibacter muris]
MKIIKYKDLKMKNKLFIGFLLVIAVLVSLLGYFSMTFSEQSIRTQMLDSIQETMAQMGENIEGEIQKVLDVSAQVCLNQDLGTILQEEKPKTIEDYYRKDRTMRQILNDSYATYFSVEDVFVCSYNGSVYGSDKNKLSLTAEYDFTRTDWFEDMKQSGAKVSILSQYDSSSYISTGEPQKLFSIVKKIYNYKSGKEIGCLIIHMNSDILGNVLQSVNSNEYQQCLIIDNNKKIIYHPDSDYIGTQYREARVSELLTVQNGYMESLSEKGYLVFSTSPVTGWSVVCVVDNEYIMDSINRLRLFLILTALFCVILSVYFASYISRTISDPVARLQRKMHQVGEGDFDIRAATGASDEIGQLTMSFDKMVERTKQLIENVYQSEIYQKEAELNALQAQINPHFLYNTLQTIDMMAEEEEADEISDACQALSKIFRYSINRGQEFVHVQDELVHIENYMLIQKLRFGNKLDVRYDIQEDCRELYIVKLLIQPMVENAVVHGMENVLNKCLVTIRVYRDRDCLYAEVEDNGTGIGTEQLDELNEKLGQSGEQKMVHEVDYVRSHRSIGLENTNARIKLYFGQEYGITITSEEGTGTKVRIRLPVRT